jgi:tRNA/rRNA methyltransferase
VQNTLILIQNPLVQLLKETNFVLKDARYIRPVAANTRRSRLADSYITTAASRRCYNLAMSKRRPDVRIVLVQPRNPLNLLAAARAASNFGFGDIVIVAPHLPIWEEALSRSAASLWLKNARVADTLLESVSDRNWVLGTSSLARRRLEGPPVLPLDRVSSHAARHTARAKNRDRIALVFGSEKRGLTNDDLALCHAVIRIPTNNSCPSMNLGQAVAVCCYELRQWTGSHASFVGDAPEAAASLAEVQRLLDGIESLRASTGSDANTRDRARTRKLLSRMLLRWPLTGRDVTLCLGVLRDLNWKIRNTP